MATHARKLVPLIARMWLELGDERSVTTHAVLLEDLTSPRLHDDRLRESSRREEFSMSVAIFRLRVVLRHEIDRQVAVDANGRGMVTSLLPTVVLRLHDVAVGAGGGFR